MVATLTSQQRQFLRGLAHELQPVIQIGHKGVTDALAKELDQALAAHELIKVKLGRHGPEEIEECAAELAERSGASVAQIIGKVIVLYREAEDPEDRRIELPRKQRKKKVTERSRRRKIER